MNLVGAPVRMDPSGQYVLVTLTPDIEILKTKPLIGWLGQTQLELELGDEKG